MTTAKTSTRPAAKTAAPKASTKTAIKADATPAKGAVRSPELIPLSKVLTDAGLTMTPKKARSILRRRKVAKPEAGWEFSKRQVPAILKSLQRQDIAPTA